MTETGLAIGGFKTAPPDVPLRRRLVQPTAVDFGQAAGIGLVLSLVFYGVVVYPLRGLYFGQIFLERGWITKIEAYLACCAIAFMGLKALRLRQQKKWSVAATVALAGESVISQAGADRLASQLSHDDPSRGRGFLMRTLRECVVCYAKEGNRDTTASLLGRLSDSDANGVESSYTMLRVLIWAIPILGFIGTVMGLGGAVGGFAGSLDRAADISALKNSLSGVTSGLSVAFDATFAALAISLLVMFPASWLEKAEMDVLGEADDVCTNSLLGKLEPGIDRREDRTSLIQAIATSLGESLAVRIGEEWDRQQQCQRAIQQEIESTLKTTLGDSLNRTIGELQAVVKAIYALESRFDSSISAASTGLDSHVQRMDRLVSTHAELMARADGQLTETLGRLEATISGAANAVVQPAQVELQTAIRAFTDSAARFSVALDQSLAAQSAHFKSVTDAGSDRLTRAHAQAADDFQRITAEWGHTVQGTTRLLADAMSAMTDAVSREQVQAVAKLELLLGRLSPHARREDDDGHAAVATSVRGPKDGVVVPSSKE